MVCGVEVPFDVTFNVQLIDDDARDVVYEKPMVYSVSYEDFRYIIKQVNRFSGNIPSLSFIPEFEDKVIEQADGLDFELDEDISCLRVAVDKEIPAELTAAINDALSLTEVTVYFNECYGEEKELQHMTYNVHNDVIARMKELVTDPEGSNDDFNRLKAADKVMYANATEFLFAELDRIYEDSDRRPDRIELLTFPMEAYN